MRWATPSWTPPDICVASLDYISELTSVVCNLMGPLRECDGCAQVAATLTICCVAGLTQISYQHCGIDEYDIDTHYEVLQDITWLQLSYRATGN